MKSLILYFSYSNNTKNLVEEVNKEFGFDVVRIERKEPYSSDYDTCAYGEAKDEWENKIYPEIKDLGVDLAEYGRILLFFPIWWYTFPMPVGTVIKGMDEYKGEVVLFENSYTNDAQYARNSLKDFVALAPSVKVMQGLFNKSAEEHIAFLKGE